MKDNSFDPYTKEQQLRQESQSWDTSAENTEQAELGDIPTIDLSDYLQGNDTDALQRTALAIQTACEAVGFFSITGHQVDEKLIADTLQMTKKFHQLPLEHKQTILMDNPNWPLGGAGYLPVKNKKLPTRNTGNLNEAFIIKSSHQIEMADNQWPDDSLLPGFQSTVTRYAAAIEGLGKKLLPLFATALEMPADFFDKGFEQPTYRLRMTHYPALKSQPDSEYGIAPHVDTSFCTILLQDKVGLTIFNERFQKWMQVPYIDNAFIINSGELMRQWTNDRFLSVKHFANNNSGNTSRYSIPFFLNANADYPMECIPSCCSEDNPAKYPTISYATSQAIAQGE